MSNENLALERAAQPTFSEMEKMATAVAKSGLFGLKTPEQALSLMLVAQADGLHPAIAARDYHIIQGKPSKTAEAMLRDFQRNGGTVEWHELTDIKADATFSHPAGGKVRISWDKERVKQAGLTTNPLHVKYPRQMLRSRVVSEGVRTVFPGATSGMYVPEEIIEIAETKPIFTTPAPAPAATKPPEIVEKAVATESHKKRFVERMAGNPKAVPYFVEAGILLPTENLKDLPLEKCPTTKVEFEEILAKIEAFQIGDPIKILREKCAENKVTEAQVLSHLTELGAIQDAANFEDAAKQNDQIIRIATEQISSITEKIKN